MRAPLASARSGAAITVLGVALIVASSAACARDRSTAPGAAPEALVVDYCLLNVHTDAETVHFEGPEALIASVEGAGPLTLDLRVHEFLIPTVSVTGHCKPKDSTVSSAVGYSLQERFGLTDYARLVVAMGSFQRVEAYADFRRTAFEIRDASCGAFLGTGAAYRPIGVHFEVVSAVDVALPDHGVHVYVPVGDGPPGGLVPVDTASTRDGGQDAAPPHDGKDDGKSSRDGDGGAGGGGAGGDGAGAAAAGDGG